MKKKLIITNPGILSTSGDTGSTGCDVSNRRDVFEKLENDKLGYAFSVWRMEGAFHNNNNNPNNMNNNNNVCGGEYIGYKNEY